MKNPAIFFDSFQMPRFDIAAGDLCLTGDLTMPSGTVYKKGKKYFTYPEIIEILSYANCRVLKRGETSRYLLDLPTDEECKMIIEKFAHRDGNCHSYHLATSLGLGFYGTIGFSESIEDYNESPQDFIYSQAICYNVTGGYWCKGTGEFAGQASVLRLNSCGEPTISKIVFDNGARIGESVRLIRRPF